MIAKNSQTQLQVLYKNMKFTEGRNTSVTIKDVNAQLT